MAVIESVLKEAYKIIRSIPLSLRLLKYDVSDLKDLPLPKGHSPGVLHALYLVLPSEIELLHLSLHSLTSHASELGTIHLVMDCDRPLEANQQSRLKDSFPQIRFHTSRYRMNWGGPGFMISKIHVLRLILSKMSDQDYVISLDPDVLFQSNAVFTMLSDQEVDTFGHAIQPPQNRGKQNYLQGGCYFLSRDAVATLVKAKLFISMWRVGYLTRQWLPNCPEDFLISELTKHLPRRYGSFMSLVPESDGSAPVLHFTEGDKLNRMRAFLSHKKREKIFS